MEEPALRDRWDAIILGGALSGAATACLLKRRNPRLRVLILEADTAFQRRVGESTVEISAYFLGRVLGLTEHLNQEHLVKQGLRFWFMNERTHTLDDCSETGPGYNVRLPGYQVDRAVLDEEVLSRAAQSGAEVRRGVRVRDVELRPGAVQSVHWSAADGTTGTELARWVIDATGVSAFLARKNGWLVPNLEHPIASVWSRWRGVKNWDSAELAAVHPAWAGRTRAVRFTATNHLVGYGWWAWWIPLKGGDVSIGVVFDQRLVDLPDGAQLGERLRAMLCAHPVARELLADASWTPGDVHLRRNLAYRSTVSARPGCVLVGDALGFMDPFYSPGMDWVSYSATAAAALVDDCCRGKPAQPRVDRHNERFTTSYQRWFEAIYRDKYFYMGDHQLMTLAFRLDLGLYYLGVVSQPFKYGPAALEVPSFASPHSKWPAKMIAFYNRRFAKIARLRRVRGTWGRTNQGRYFGFRSYEFNGALPWRVFWALLSWGSLELTEGWRTWFRAPATVPLRDYTPARTTTPARPAAPVSPRASLA